MCSEHKYICSRLEGAEKYLEGAGSISPNVNLVLQFPLATYTFVVKDLDRVEVEEVEEPDTWVYALQDGMEIPVVSQSTRHFTLKFDQKYPKVKDRLIQAVRILDGMWGFRYSQPNTFMHIFWRRV